MCLCLLTERWPAQRVAAAMIAVSVPAYLQLQMPLRTWIPCFAHWPPISLGLLTGGELLLF